MMCIVRLAAVLSLMAGALALPVDAHAQLGGLVKKKIGEKIADKAVDKVMPTQQGGEATSPPKFDDVVLEVTEERFEAFLRGLEAERAAAAEYRQVAAAAEAKRKTQDADRRAASAKYDREFAEYDRKQQAYQDCQMKFAEQVMRDATSDPSTEKIMRRMASMSEAERDRFQKRVERWSKIVEDADRRNDTAVAAAMFDSLEVLYRDEFGVSFKEMNARMARRAPTGDVTAKCGSQPQAPEQPVFDDAHVPDARDYVITRGARASGMSAQQFGVMRERLEMWWSGRRPGFSQAELALFESRRPELKKYERQFTRNDPNEWLR
jgi:hypothetical protein